MLGAGKGARAQDSATRNTDPADKQAADKDDDANKQKAPAFAT